MILEVQNGDTIVLTHKATGAVITMSVVSPPAVATELVAIARPAGYEVEVYPTGVAANDREEPMNLGTTKQ